MRHPHERHDFDEHQGPRDHHGHDRHQHDKHHDHYGRDHRGPRGRGGPGRFFESGDLRFVILHLISDTPRHGYEIIKMIESQLAGAHSPSPGIIYPTLTMLEEMGLAAITVEGSRKLYSITEEGKKELETNRASTDAILQRMQQAGQRHEKDQSGPLVRALENLKLVLRMRSNQLSQDQVATATDIIDNAAKQIERL